MRQRPPRAGFSFAWDDDLDDTAKFANWPTRRQRDGDMDAALHAEAAAYGTAQVRSVAGWSPVTPELLREVADGLGLF